MAAGSLLALLDDITTILVEGIIGLIVGTIYVGLFELINFETINKVRLKQ